MIESTIPRSIVELIYRQSCCKPTPEEAQKEPCACVAASIVDQIEDWHDDEITRLREEVKLLKEISGRQEREINTLNELQDCKGALQRLGAICGCDHVESADERAAQVQHIEEAFDKLREEVERLKAELLDRDRHIFESPREATEDDPRRETCRKCGRNLRDEVHLRISQSLNTGEKA